MMSIRQLATGVLLLALALGAGCSAISGEPASRAVEEAPHQTRAVSMTGQPPDTVTWIKPSKVQVDNFYAGARAEHHVTVHNGNDSNATFSVQYRYPDSAASGFAMPTLAVSDWVLIADESLMVAANATVEVPVVLDMPEDAPAPGEQWEFWIAVRDTSQTGLVHTELCSRWLVSMREE